MMNNKYAFYLLGKKGYIVLSSIIQNFGTRIIAYVVVGTDINVKHDYSSEIKELCKQNSLEFFNRNNIQNNLSYDFAIAIGWRWIINNSDKLVVLHDSLLPHYRGFAPLVNALINGEKNVGVSALFASSEYDRGNIIYQESMDVSYPIKISCAIDQISECYIKCINNVIRILNTNIDYTGIVQDEKLATYSLWRDESDYLINWNQDAESIKRFVDAVGYPYSGAQTRIGDNVFFVINVEVIQGVIIESRSQHVGKVVFVKDNCPIVICREGLLKITNMLNQSNENVLPLSKFRVKFQ